MDPDKTQMHWAGPPERLGLVWGKAPTLTCPECGRVFNLDLEVDAGEWYYGHDCEEVNHED